MKELMNILGGLGVDWTIFVQFGLFVVVLLYLWHVTFKPYLASYSERQEKTVGHQDAAEEIVAQTRELESIYQREARGLNQEVKSLFDKNRLEAQKEHERILVEAKDKAKDILDVAKGRVQDEYNRAREELLKESAGLGQSISARLLSKES